MHITSYQIHNVLNAYCQQLRQRLVADKKNSALNRSRPEQIQLSLKGKKQATIEKVSKDIFEKITRIDSLAENEGKRIRPTKSEPVEATAADQTSEKPFVFNMMDNLSKKQTNALSVKDPKLLIQGLEQLAVKAANQETESCR
jgi:hypothetical protein